MYRSTIFLIFLGIKSTLMHSKHFNDSTGDQLIMFTFKASKPVGLLTTSSGASVTLEDTQTINSNLILNNFFMESITHLVRERIPERVVHAKGTGAFGYFKVTHDVSHICKAKFLNKVGKETAVAVRFSSVVQRPGGSDTTRENRGFAVKFFTEEGIFDYVGITAEMFQIKDPMFFPTFVHAFHKNPTTQVPDVNSLWDFFTLRPESLNLAMRLFGDRGIPDGYRHMPSFTIHTYELTNAEGERNFGRFHLLPNLGFKNLTSPEARKIQGEDLDYATRDLYNAIANRKYPTWTLYVQTIPVRRVDKVQFDIFDITKFWPVDKFELKPLGILTLTENPKNHFADIEQLAFNPGNLVPGIRGSDKVFEARVLAYREAQIHRLGVNFNNIRVNSPFKTAPRTYNRDGSPPIGLNEGDTPNYFPNSFHGPLPNADHGLPLTSVKTDPKATNFDQAAMIYEEMNELEKCRLIENIIESLMRTEVFLQERAVSWFKLINAELGKKINMHLILSKNTSYVYYPCDVDIRNNTV